MRIMGGVFKECTKDIDNLAGKVKTFAEQVKKQHVPQYLQPGNLFLGKYLINQIMPYSFIEENKLLEQDSVFPKKNIA